MTTRNFEYLFNPRSVALIGASDKPHTVGAVLAANLLSGGFRGPVYLVHPTHRSIGGMQVFPDVQALPSAPDLAVIATPAHTIPEIIRDLGKIGTRAVIVISAGFGETNHGSSSDSRQQMLDASSPTLLRIVGPNCLGMMLPGIGLNASFAHTMPGAGHIAFVAQSGAIVTSVLDWAVSRGIGFSRLVSLGNMVDVDFGDMLDFLASDQSTHAILLYIESITHARKFMSAARAAARSKPVIVVKSGRHAEGARAVASHTGSMAGLDDVYDAAFRRAGMLRVKTLNELFDATESLSSRRIAKGGRLAIVTNGGGIGILATDTLIDSGGCLAELTDDAINRLNQCLPSAWSHSNPVDIVGDATGGRYKAVLQILLREPDIDCLLVLNCPTAITSGIDAAVAVVEAASQQSRIPVITSWVGEAAAVPARKLFAENRIPTYDTPEQAVASFMHMVQYENNQNLLIQTPPSVPEGFIPDVQSARKIIRQAVEQRRQWLKEVEAKAVLTAFGIPCVATTVCQTPATAMGSALEIGGPVALKILSPDISHKSDVGGVALNLERPEDVKHAAVDMLRRVKKLRPDASIEGFTVQPMVSKPEGQELILGAFEDEKFGPVLLFGKGGTAVEIINDKTLELPPLNIRLARSMIERTRVYRLLQGYRNNPAADLSAVELMLVRLSTLVVELSEVVELDINPVVSDADGVLALDARIKVRSFEDHMLDRTAIRPYPDELEEDIVLSDGRKLLLRPITPEDEPSIRQAFSTLSKEEVRLRFFLPMKELNHVTAARFTQIDYDREMALILTEQGIHGTTEIYGVVRIFTDPNNEKAEFAVIVHHKMTGLGLGTLLMKRIIDYSKMRGTKVIFGDVLRRNLRMLTLCEELGFKHTSVADDPGVIRVTMDLDAG